MQTTPFPLLISKTALCAGLFLAQLGLFSSPAIALSDSDFILSEEEILAFEEEQVQALTAEISASEWLQLAIRTKQLNEALEKARDSQVSAANDTDRRQSDALNNIRILVNRLAEENRQEAVVVREAATIGNSDLAYIQEIALLKQQLALTHVLAENQQMMIADLKAEKDSLKDLLEDQSNEIRKLTVNLDSLQNENLTSTNLYLKDLEFLTDQMHEQNAVLDEKHQQLEAANNVHLELLTAIAIKDDTISQLEQKLATSSTQSQRVISYKNGDPQDILQMYISTTLAYESIIEDYAAGQKELSEGISTLEGQLFVSQTALERLQSFSAYEKDRMEELIAQQKNELLTQQYELKILETEYTKLAQEAHKTTDGLAVTDASAPSNKNTLDIFSDNSLNSNQGLGKHLDELNSSYSPAVITPASNSYSTSESETAEKLKELTAKTVEYQALNNDYAVRLASLREQLAIKDSQRVYAESQLVDEQRKYLAEVRDLNRQIEYYRREIAMLQKRKQ